jgi:hypothetical protein
MNFLAELIPTQSDVRRPNEIVGMMRYLRNHKVFDTQDKIVLKKFRDGRTYIHDGHHRCLAKSLLGMDLHESEFVIKPFTYHKFKQVNLDVGWVTPFDLKTEVRYADIQPWKRHIEEVRQRMDEHTLLDYIMSSGPSYKKPREVFNMTDMVIRFVEKNIR